MALLVYKQTNPCDPYEYVKLATWPNTISPPLQQSVCKHAAECTTRVHRDLKPTAHNTQAWLQGSDQAGTMGESVNPKAYPLADAEVRG